MILLGLAGHAGSGKDSVADYLVSRYGFIKFSFADALRREIVLAFGLDNTAILEDHTTKEMPHDTLALEFCTNDEFVALALSLGVPSITDPISPRWLQQVWGTEFRRAADPDYWVTQAEDWLIQMHTAPTYPEHRPMYFVNTSVRFENERQWVHDCEGNVWHLRRDAATPVAGHVSETPLPVLEGEREIFNNHTLDYLHKGVDQLLTSGVQFVRLEPPVPMDEPQPSTGEE